MARNLFNTGDNRTSISDSEKAAFGSGTVNAFNVTWGILKGLIQNSFTSLKIGGTTRIDASGNVTAGNVVASGSGSFSNLVNINKNTLALASSDNIKNDSVISSVIGINNLTLTSSTEATGLKIGMRERGNFAFLTTFPTTSKDSSEFEIWRGSDISSYSKLISINGSGIAVTGNAVVSGTVTAAGYLPFTGCHIAKSKENLKLGELVEIKSIGWINDKQPDWEASYCNKSKKGIYGVVYDIINVEAVEAQEATDDTEAIEAVEAHTYYHIAATGDAFVEIDCPCEYGDVLIPSETKGLATVSKDKYIPLNMVGFAGEDSEGGKIAYTKE